VTKAQLSNVYFLPPVPKTCVPELLSHMDVLYLGWRRKPLYRFGVSPNKLVDYMMAGKPIIHALEANPHPGSKYDGALSIPPEDPAAIAGAVEQLMRLSPGERAMLGNRSRTFARKYHDYSFLAKRFLDVMAGRPKPNDIPYCKTSSVLQTR
jgi:hypothetical protein